MSRAVPDAPPGLPDGEVTPEGLRAVTLPVVLRGYRMADVDEVLERAAAELEHARAAAGIRPVEPRPSPGPLPVAFEKPERPTPGQWPATWAATPSMVELRVSVDVDAPPERVFARPDRLGAPGRVDARHHGPRHQRQR